MAAGAMRQAHLTRMRKIRIDDSTPSPPPLDLQPSPEDAKNAEGCTFVLGSPPHIVGSTSSPIPLDLPCSDDAKTVFLVSLQPPPGDIVVSSSSPEDADNVVLVSLQPPPSHIIGSTSSPLPIANMTLVTMSDVFEISSVSSCSGSSDSDDPVSRKARKLAAKLQSFQAKRERDARLMNCWLSTPKKSCQYLDLECAHYSTDGSSAYSTSNSSVLTEGFIDDDDEGKENYPPDEDVLFTQAFLPITARALNIKLKK